jgi:hypothetical protein
VGPRSFPFRSSATSQFGIGDGEFSFSCFELPARLAAQQEGGRENHRTFGERRPIGRLRWFDRVI